MPKLKCAYSEVECKLCDRNPTCPIYTDRYVLRDQLKKLKKALEDTLTIAKAILER